MEYNFFAKGTTLTDALKQKASDKIKKIEKLLPQNSRIDVSFKVVKLEQKVEITVHISKIIIRAESSSKDMYDSINDAVSTLEKRIKKLKKHNKNYRENIKTTENLKDNFNYEDNEEENIKDLKIERIKKFNFDMLTPEEAVLEMELLGHNFYLFKNAFDNQINVVYKRGEEAYGLIEPNSN